MTPQRFSKLKAALRACQPDLTVLADGVHKPHNVSAILRSCDAVGIHRMHAVSADSELRSHHVMAGGSKRWVDVRVHDSIEAGVDTLRGDGWQLLVANAGPDACDFRDVDYTQRLAIILGAELSGPSRHALEHADLAIQIPMQGLVESLNVSVAAAVILFEAQRQRAAAGLYAESRLDPEEFARTLFEWAYPDIARRCRRQRLTYPALSEDGTLLENPFSG